jgi:hypothetical protein
MALASTTNAKFFISGSGSTPAANSTAATATQFAALTYIEVKPIESIGEFGDTADTITFAALGDGRKRKQKGVRDSGELAVVAAHDPLENGQKAMVAAEQTSFYYAFKVLLADAADSNDTDTVVYFRGLVSKASLSIGASNEFIKRNYSILIDTAPLEIPSTAVSGP